MTNLTADQSRALHAQHHEQRERNRALFPEGAALVDSIRDIFGGGKVVYFGDVRDTTRAVYSEDDPQPLPDSE
jgi:hypothetical protein